MRLFSKCIKRSGRQQLYIWEKTSHTGSDRMASLTLHLVVSSMSCPIGERQPTPSSTAMEYGTGHRRYFGSWVAQLDKEAAGQAVGPAGRKRRMVLAGNGDRNGVQPGCACHRLRYLYPKRCRVHIPQNIGASMAV